MNGLLALNFLFFLASNFRSLHSFHMVWMAFNSATLTVLACSRHLLTPLLSNTVHTSPNSEASSSSRTWCSSVLSVFPSSQLHTQCSCHLRNCIVRNIQEGKSLQLLFTLINLLQKKFLHWSPVEQESHKNIPFHGDDAIKIDFDVWQTSRMSSKNRCSLQLRGVPIEARDSFTTKRS